MFAFLVLSSSPGFEIKEFAIGLAAGIIFDATVIRALLVPSLMELLGQRNWWLPTGRGARCSSGRSGRRRAGARSLTSADPARLRPFLLRLRGRDAGGRRSISAYADALLSSFQLITIEITPNPQVPPLVMDSPGTSSRPSRNSSSPSVSPSSHDALPTPRRVSEPERMPVLLAALHERLGAPAR